ncbi:MAG: hypothetical protein ACR2QT_08300 [Woeseiaceae bacterium]
MKDPSSQSSTSPKKSNLPWHRRWLAKVWLAYGGGLYAVGYALTFIYLEAQSILEEVLEADGLVDFLTSHLLEFFFRFLGDSISNMVQAFIWFLPFFDFRPPLGFILLGVGFFVFDIYLRKPVGDWLLREED